MTIENCQRLAEHCKKMNDTAGVKYYQDRINRKMKRFGITEEIKTEEKEDGKKSKR